VICFAQKLFFKLWYKDSYAFYNFTFIMAAVASQWRSNLKPVSKPLQTNSPRRKPAALEIPKVSLLPKTWPPKDTNETKSPIATA